MTKTKVRYYVDIVDKETGQTVVTVYDSYNSDEAYDVASHWNEDLFSECCVLHNPCVMAEVYEVEEYIEGECEMKKCICPNCGKELVRLEPFEVGVYKFWCDD